MTDLPPTQRRKHHAAARARTLVAGVSAGAFVALGGAMALANSAHAISTPTTATEPPSRSITQPVDPFAQVEPDDRSSDDWAAQPSAPSAPSLGSSGGGSSGAGNTTTHGS